MKIDLIWFTDSSQPPQWEMGELSTCKRNVGELTDTIKNRLMNSIADGILFWDSSLGQPNPNKVERIFNSPGDLWHAGLKLGTAGKPELINYIQPTWMLNCDGQPDIASTSWRISLKACLINTDVLRQFQLNPLYSTLEGAALDWGLRLLKSGIIPRYIPDLLDTYEIEDFTLPVEDEIRIIDTWSNRIWVKWAILNSIIAKDKNITEVLRAAMIVFKEKKQTNNTKYYNRKFTKIDHNREYKIDVLIPTVQRYPYLRVLLNQLRQQTVKPTRIIIIDQTPFSEREYSLAEEFNDLPLHLIYLDTPGQCTARNAGITASQGDYILFLDDDVEIDPDTIIKHLEVIENLDAEVSAGTVHEPDEVNKSSDTPIIQVSSVFPTDNVMINKGVLRRSGLFDLAYDHGARADGDLGMRLRLHGAIMIQNSSNDILHHHAPRGGLRIHGARVITAKQRKTSHFSRNTPSVTELYLAKRYFSQKQVNSLIRILALATLKGGGKGILRHLSVIKNIILLPKTLIQIHINYNKAKQMLLHYPKIPLLH